MNEALQIIKSYEKGERLDPKIIDPILLKASEIPGSGVELRQTRFAVGGGRTGEVNARTYFCLNRYTVTVAFSRDGAEGSVAIWDNGIENRLVDDARLIE